MLLGLLIGLLPAPPVLVQPATLPARAATDDLDAQIAAAGSNVTKLLALAAASTNEDGAKRVYKRVLEIDAHNETARKALRHQLYDGKWFESFAELSKYKREEAARMKEKGLARFKDEWVPERDLPFLNMGWAKDGQGAWRNPAEIERERQIEEWKAAGYQFRADDNSWIAPADVDKWAALLWKCGDEWLDLTSANAYHSKLDSHWELVGQHFDVWATCDWESANVARWHADRVHAELERLFGIQPARRPHILVLASLGQYNEFAGNGTIGESEGFSSLHGAYFADAFFDGSKPPQYLGCGVTYWDRKDQKLAAWGPFWVRWAAAQSFVEAIDPSWQAVGERVAGGTSGDAAGFGPAFWNEKRIPRWLRYGAAAYAERFLRNPQAAPDADPWTLRAFACAELKKSGGLRRLDDVFRFALSLNDIPGSSRLYQEAGLLVSYLLDGAPNDRELADVLQALRTALASGTKADVANAASALQKALLQREKKIRTYAGL
ncbi:MAG: hypothetical protein JNK02_11070 [Planctomycetes bacterium]|nr:hypothetical protein [Planctomycetota bacterium]